MTKPQSAPGLSTKMSPETLDQVRLNLDWQAMFVGLGLRKCDKKSKPNDWWAYSPFHDEKTPSFHMASGGLWYDFSIGEGGGAVELVQRIENCDCYRAGALILERGWSRADDFKLGSKAVAKPVANETKGAVDSALKPPKPKNEAIRQDLMPLCQYHDAIHARGVSEETATMLGIGYLPQGRSQLKGRIVFQIADARPDAQGTLDRVILSHLGRAVGDAEPKYLFYEGFHKSAELYGQELMWLHEDAAQQARACGHVLVTEGPFDVAVAVEGGLRNVVASFGANLSKAQAGKLKAICDHIGVCSVKLAFDRDAAGQAGAAKATKTIQQAGLDVTCFDWNAAVGVKDGEPFKLPNTINDLADFKPDQLVWLRGRALI